MVSSCIYHVVFPHRFFPATPATSANVLAVSSFVLVAPSLVLAFVLDLPSRVPMLNAIMRDTRPVTAEDTHPPAQTPPPTRQLLAINMLRSCFVSSNHLLQYPLLFQLADAERGFGEGAGLGERRRTAARLADFTEGTLRALACEHGRLVAEPREGIRLSSSPRMWGHSDTGRRSSRSFAFRFRRRATVAANLDQTELRADSFLLP